MYLSYFSKHVARALLLVVISAAFTACGDRGGNSDDGGTTGTRPTASAGADQTVDAGDLVILNGRNSSDPQDLPLTYTWEQLEGPTVTLSEADTVRATFTAPSFPTNTTLTFALTVDNGTANAIDTVVIRVNDDANTLTPTANAGRNQTVIAGDAVRLDGSASSGGGGATLAYSWAQISGDTVVLVDQDRAVATFTAPAVSELAELRFRLTVSSGSLADSDNVLVTVNPVPDTTPPTILTRSPAPGATGVSRSATVTVGFDEAMLEASIDGTTFRLRQGTSNTAGTFDYDASANVLTFTPTRNLAGNRLYTVLIDGITDLAGNPLATTQWTFTTSANAGPNVVVTDDDQFLTRGLPAELDASGSTDDLTPEDQLQFEWTQTAGTAVVLSDPTAANPSFDTDALEIETLVFAVTVTDEDGIGSTVENVYVTLLENAANALFVSSTGADVNDGARDEPFRTISRALSAANAAPSPRPDIYMTTGSYAAPLTLNISSGVSIYGSFDLEFHRVLDATLAPDTVINGARTAMTATTITSPTYLDLVDIRAAASTASGVNSVGLAVIDSSSASPRFIILRTNITARNGANGADGAAGVAGGDGVDGSAGERGDVLGGGDATGGPAALSTCGLGDSGQGGNGRDGDRAGRSGGASEDGVSGGAGGTPSADDPAVRDGEPGGSADTTLPAGDAGAVGLAAGSIVGNTWQSILGVNGNSGVGGASGGGGGGGAGFDVSRGGGGGSGGTGGCPGAGGGGGQGGSGSFALVLSNASISLQDSVLSTGDGGRGGSAGAGGSGGSGGSGGAGGAGEAEAGTGGSGGDGQAGSAGGAGGVGAGGPSIGILALSGSPLPSITSVDFNLGSPGEPGVPAVGGAAGEQGLSGLTLELGSL